MVDVLHHLLEAAAAVRAADVVAGVERDAQPLDVVAEHDGRVGVLRSCGRPRSAGRRGPLRSAAMAAIVRSRSTSALNGVPNSAERTVTVTTLVALASLQQAANCW